MIQQQDSQLIWAIFGRIRIVNFKDMLEVLQREYASFLQDISSIIYTNVERFSGQVYRNNGQTIDFYWSLPNYQNDCEIVEEEKLKYKAIADKALIAILEIQSHINRDESLIQYNQNHGLTMRFQHFKVKITTSLSLGWGICAQLFEKEKIIISDESLNENLINQIRQYQQQIVISGEVHKFLSEEIKKNLRMIDVVVFRGMRSPCRIYTIDLKLNDLAQNKQDQTSDDECLTEEKEVINVNEITDTVAYFNKNKDIQLIIEDENDKFKSLFKDGLEFYIKGDWQESKVTLEKVLQMKQNDGPTLALINYMKETGFQSKKDWYGYRFIR